MTYSPDDQPHPKANWIKKPALCLFMWRGCKHRRVWVGLRSERCADCGVIL